MRVLVLGYGSAGKRHAANASTLGCDVMVYDTSPAVLLSQQERCPYWLAKSEAAARVWCPDAVVLATPAATHAELLAQWWHLPILCEKPLALAATDLDWVEAPRVQIGCNWRHHPLVRSFRDRWQAQIPGGAYPERAIFWCLCDMTTWPGAAYADALLEIGSHEIDLALHLFGPAGLTSARRPEPQGWVLELFHESGAVTKVVLNGSDPTASRGLRTTWGGYNGGYDIDYDNSAEAECLAHSYKAEMVAFLDGVQRGVPSFSPSPEDGMAVLRIIDEARRRVAEAAHG